MLLVHLIEIIEKTTMTSHNFFPPFPLSVFIKNSFKQFKRDQVPARKWPEWLLAPGNNFLPQSMEARDQESNLYAYEMTPNPCARGGGAVVDNGPST